MVLKTIDVGDSRTFGLGHFCIPGTGKIGGLLDGVCSKYGGREFLDHIDYLATRPKQA